MKDKNVKILMLVGLALNTLLSLWLVAQKSPESLEIMKAGGKENYEMMEKIFTSDAFKSQQKAGLAQSLAQFGASSGAKTDDTKAPDTQAPATPDVVKSDKPEVSLFIMSYCPYGLQAQKGMLDVMKRMGGVADIKIKFVHYLMHGPKEAQENVRQYCIQSEQPEKYNAYQECFLKAGEIDSCLATAKIDKDDLDDCYEDAYKKYDVEKNIAEGGQYPPFGIDAEESKAAGVQGSPTLVINGKIVNTGRSANDYKEAICAAFNKKPAVCDEEFVKAQYDPQFGFTSNGSTVAGGCGQ